MYFVIDTCDDSVIDVVIKKHTTQLHTTHTHTTHYTLHTTLHYTLHTSEEEKSLLSAVYSDEDPDGDTDVTVEPTRPHASVGVLVREQIRY